MAGQFYFALSLEFLKIHPSKNLLVSEYVFSSDMRLLTRKNTAVPGLSTACQNAIRRRREKKWGW